MQLGRIEPEKWYHVVLTTTSPIITDNPFYFGKQSTNYFSGCIDDFRLYKKVLTPTEVKHLYNRQLSGNNLALHLPLSEPNNTSLDDKSIYQHTTTNHGVESGDIGPVGGSIKFNPFGALNFDGTDDYVNLSSHSAALADFSGGFSFSGWVKWDATPGYSRILDFSSGSTNDNIIIYHHLNTTSLVFNVVNGSGTQSHTITATGYIVLNTWIHVGVTFNNSTKLALSLIHI